MPCHILHHLSPFHILRLISSSCWKCFTLSFAALPGRGAFWHLLIVQKPLDEIPHLALTLFWIIFFRGGLGRSPTLRWDILRSFPTRVDITLIQCFLISLTKKRKFWEIYKYIFCANRPNTNLQVHLNRYKVCPYFIHTIILPTNKGFSFHFLETK